MISPVMTSLMGCDRYPLVWLASGAAKAAAIARAAVGCLTARAAIASLGASLDILWFWMKNKERKEGMGNK